MPGLKADFSMPGVGSGAEARELYDMGGSLDDFARKTSDVSLSLSNDSPNTNISTGCASDITCTTEMTSVAPSGPPTGQPQHSGMSAADCFSKPSDLAGGAGAGEPGLPPQVHNSFFPSIEQDEFSGVLADLDGGWGGGNGGLEMDMEMEMEREMGGWLGGGGFG